MKTQLIYLDNYDWLIKVFYLVKNPDIDLILGELDSIDCDPEAFYKAADMLEHDDYNTGFTYTDDEKRVTFIIISKTTSAAQFFNTFIHEIGHTSMHISEYIGINPYSEEIQYLQGEIAAQMFEKAKQFMCDSCRINFYNYGKLKIKIKED